MTGGRVETTTGQAGGRDDTTTGLAGGRVETTTGQTGGAQPEQHGASTVRPVASLIDAPAGLLMIGLGGPAPVCVDGVCAPMDDHPEHPAR